MIEDLQHWPSYLHVLMPWPWMHVHKMTGLKRRKRNYWRETDAGILRMAGSWGWERDLFFGGIVEFPQGSGLAMD